MNKQKKSIEIGAMLIVQEKDNLWLWNKEGLALCLTKDTVAQLETLLSNYFKKRFER